MAKDEDMSTSDDEYHFSEIGSSASAGNVYSSGVAKKNTESTLRRNLLIGMGVLLLLFLAYKLVGVFFNKLPAREEASAAAEQVTQVKQSQEQQRAESLAKEKQLAAQQVMDQRLREQHMQQVSGNVERVQGQLLDVGNRMRDMTMFMERMAQQVQQQQQIVQQLQLQLQQAQASKAAKKGVPDKQAKVQPRDPYFIKAIIPGRAWLLSKAGNFLTVTHGTIVPRYGRVEYIDAAKGLVSTSSGDLISYSASDI